MKPHICPVCRGRGLVPVDFYLSQTGELGSIAGDERCRSCNGTGIVWHEDNQYIRRNHEKDY